VLERALRPGEVSLDELERAFRETEIEVAAPALAPDSAPVRLEIVKDEAAKPAKKDKAEGKAAAKPKKAA
ncbi:hypothetical protein NP284_38005, partial [Rhodopseudomonas pseudopalustris]